MPAEQRASEGVGGIWPHGMTSLTSMELYVGARLTEKLLQSEEENAWKQR